MALLNLAVNARDAMPNGGQLQIRATIAHLGEACDLGLAPGDYVMVSVRDSGSGMDDETLRRAVEPFFSTKGVGRGTGLGLSMVHGLMAQLGGTMRIESVVGDHTTVALWFPVAAEDTPDANKIGDRLGRRRGPAGKVLLVDDEELVRSSTAVMLAGLGFDVVEAASAEEAIDAIEHGAEFDVLITDYLMSGHTGLVLADRVRRTHPDKPVLLLSGYADVASLGESYSLLPKPFRQDELADALEEVLRADWTISS